jgi:hypothetical protein
MDLLTTAPGLTAIAALITAIAGVSGFYGGTRAAAQAPQPAVTVTVTAPARTVTVPAPVTSPAASTAASSANSPAPKASTAGSAYLADLSPLQDNEAGTTVTDGSQEIGTRTYPNSVRITCSYPGDWATYDNPSSVVYRVTSYNTLNVFLGVPGDAANASGNTATIDFFKDGTTTKLVRTVTIALDQPKNIPVPLKGASQLTISCSGSTNDIDVVLGNATLSS